MKILIKEQQLENLAYRFVLDKLNDMNFKFRKNREFSFFPKGGSSDASLGVEADWVKGEGFDILVGNTLWRSVQDMFNLTDEQVQTLFIKAFIQFGITKISEVTTLDFSPFRDRFDINIDENIIKESKIDNLVLNYLNSQDWRVWDIGDGEFNVADGEFGKDLFRFRIQYSSRVTDHSFNVIYISDDLVSKISELFGIGSEAAIKSIINWFNQKYDKNLTMDDFEWLDSDTFYADEDDEFDEQVIKEQFDGDRLYSKDEILRLLKGAPRELKQIAKKLPNIPCENDKGVRTICTKIPEAIHVYLTGRY